MLHASGFHFAADNEERNRSSPGCVWGPAARWVAPGFPLQCARPNATARISAAIPGPTALSIFSPVSRKHSLVLSSIAVAALALLCIAMAAGSHYYASPAAARSLSRMLTQRGALAPQLDSVQLSPLRGIRLKSLHAAFPVADSMQVDVECGPSELRFRSLPFLTMLWKLRGGGHPVLDSAWIMGALVGGIVRRLHLSMSVQRFGRLEACGTAGVSRRNPHHMLTVPLAIDSLRCSGRRIGKVDAIIGLNPSSVTLGGVSGSLFDAELAARAVVRATGAVDTLELLVRHLSLTKLWQTCGDTGTSVSGALSFDFATDHGSPGAGPLVGRGTARADSVVVSRGQLLTALSSLLSAPALRTARFDSLDSRFSLHDAALHIDSLHGSGPAVSFSSRGWVAFDGRLKQYVAGTFTRTFMKELAPVARKSLLPGPGGTGRFAFTVHGTTEQAIVSLDKALLDRAVASVADAMRESFLKEMGR